MYVLAKDKNTWGASICATIASTKRNSGLAACKCASLKTTHRINFFSLWGYTQAMTRHLWFKGAVKGSTSPLQSVNLIGIFLSAVLTAAHILPSFTGPSSRRGRFNRRAGESQTLFVKYYLLAGRERGCKFTSKKVSLHATSYSDWRTCKQNLQTFSRRYDSRCISRTWREVNSSWTKQTVQLKKKRKKKKAGLFVHSLSSLCGNCRTKAQDCWEKMRRVRHETPFSMAVSVLHISPN